MNFKVGQRIIAVANGFNYGVSADSRGSLHTRDYAIGWKGTMGDDNVITFDNGRVIRGCSNDSFELINESEEETVEYKVGDNVRIVRNADQKGFPSKSKYIGETFTITKMAKDYPRGTGIWDDSKTDDVCYYAWYKDELELVPQLSVGSKVLWDDKSYALEMDNGILQTVPTKGYRGFDKEIYEITMVTQQLPGGEDYKGDPQTNDTIIRRISDGGVFFVQQQLLKVYVVVPKFKRGQFIEYSNGYYRVLKVNTGDSKATYDITAMPSIYNNGGQAVYADIPEDKLKEVQ